MSGLIWANLGKSISDVGANWGKQAFQLELMRLEEEKALRLDEIKRARDIRDIQPKAEAVAAAAPILAQGDAAALEITEPVRNRMAADRSTVVGAADTAVQASREEALRPGKLETARQTGIVAGEVERGNLAAYASDPNARAGTKAKTADTESSATRASAASTNFDLSQKRAVADLRTQLSKTKDPEQRGPLEQMIKDLSGSSTKSYGDMVTAAGHYRMLAQNLRKDAELALDDADRKDMLDRARYYEQEADGILRSTVDKRLGSDTKPKSGPNSGQSVGTSGSSKYKEGDIVNLKSGGQGRVVNVDGKLMVKPL